MQVYMYPEGTAGVALYNYKLANALAGRGMHVTLFTSDQYELDDLPANFAKARVLSGKYARCRSSRGQIARMVYLLGVYLHNSLKFYSCVRQKSPGIVHLHSFMFYPMEWYLLNRLKDTMHRLVLTVHNVLPTSFYLPPSIGLERSILQYMYGAADRLIVHSEVNRSQLLANFSIENEKIVVIPHGSYSLEDISETTSLDQARRKLDLTENEKVILFFGYLKRVKGVDVLLKAFDLLAEQSKDVVLFIVGSIIEGESLSECHQIMNSMKHKNRVRLFVRYVPNEEIATFFMPADVVVLPYVEFYAQSGVAHVAQGFGKAVVATDVGGLPEVIDDQQTGLIVPARDVGRLAEAIGFLLKNKEIRVRMGRRAREIALERFSWDSIAEATVRKAYLS